MRVALELNGLTVRLKKDMKGTLARVADAGFSEVSLYGSLEGAAAYGSEELEDAGLRAVAVTFNLHDLHSRFEDVMKIGRALDPEWIVLDHLDLDEYGDGWSLVGRRIVRWVDAVRENGFKLAYRNHRMEFHSDESGAGLERLLTGAGPGLYVDFDVLWARKAGQDPAEWLRKLRGRIALARFDGSCLSDLSFCSTLVKAAEDSGTDWIVLQTNPRATDPLAEAERQRCVLAAQGVAV